MAEDKIKLVRTTSIELAFPLDGVTWDEVGITGRLGTIRHIGHRLLNAAIVGLFANKHLPTEQQINALGYIKAEIAEIENKAKTEAFQDLRLPGNITDRYQTVANQAVQMYFKKKGKARIPSFGEKAPIMARNGGWKLGLDDQGRYTFSIKLWAGGHPWTRFAVRPTEGWHYSLLKRIATDPTVKPGDCKIVWSTKKKRFFAKLAFTTEDPKPKLDLDPNIVLGVHRGRNNFLYAACTEANSRGEVVYPGDDILAAKAKFKAMGLARKRMLRVTRGGAAGHGYERRYATYRAVQDAEARFIKTVCQHAAARVVKLAIQKRAGKVVLDDFTTVESEDLRYVPSWPWFQLKQAVLWACKKAGIQVIEAKSEYISSVCPRCGNLDTSQLNHRTGTFHCSRKTCGLSRPRDMVAALNMLDAEVGIPQWKKIFDEVHELSAKLKSELASASKKGASSGGKKKASKKTSRKPPSKSLK